MISCKSKVQLSVRYLDCPLLRLAFFVWPR